MNATDRKSFLEIVIGFAELKGKQLSAPALELYWNAMQRWTLGDFRDAAQHLLRTCEFMPTPKDFEDLRKAGRMTAAEAWNLALSSAHTCRTPNGYGGGGASGDPIVDNVVAALGGYAVIAMCHTDKLHFLERRFCEHFVDLQDAEDVRQSVPLIANQAIRQQLKGPAKVGTLLTDLRDRIDS